MFNDFRSTLVFPFFVLRRSLRGSLYYILIVFSAIVFLASKAQSLIGDSLDSLSENYEDHQRLFDIAALILSHGIWLPAIPFLLTAIILPACLTYRDGYAQFEALMRATPSHLRVVSYTLLLSIKAIFVTAIPALALLILYIFFARSLELKGVTTLYLAALGAVSLVSAWHIFPKMFAPLIAIAGGLSPLQALATSTPLVRRFFSTFALLTMVTVALLYFFLGVKLRYLNLFSGERLLLSALTLWYTLTALTHTSLIAIGTAVAAVQQRAHPRDDVRVTVSRAWAE